MASSINIPPSAAATISSAAAATAGASASPFLFKPNHIFSTTRNIHHRRHTISCNSDNDRQPVSPEKFDRRNVLIGLGGLYGASALSTSPLAFAAPITAPDVTKCGPADLPEGVTPTNCCPPPTAQIIDFKFPPPPKKLRVRPAAHLAGDEYIAKFNKAVEIMRALPDDDPRSFKQQANVHCAYCDGAYDQAGFPDLELQVHNSWLFFPFHRYYLYFFERILGKLIDDPNFAMPFWNWDSPAGMTIPAMYANPRSALYDPLRDRAHQPPTVVDLNFSGGDSAADQITQRNLTTMYRQMVSNSRTSRLFFGSPYRRGEDPNPGSGSIENIPHGPVHVWTGDSKQPNFENMGNFYSAGRDPIFFAHHSNIDRLWTVWKTLGGRRKDIDDRDYLDASFVFYDENAQMVRVKVRDCLDQGKLGYVYQDVEIPWLNSRPTPRISSAVRKLKNLVKARAADTAARGPKDVFPAKLDRVVKVMVKRPKKKRSRKEKDELEEILVIEGIEVDRDVYAKFDVFINDEDDEISTPDNTEFAGSFVNVPHKHKHTRKIKTQLRLSITDILEELDTEGDDHVLVTLVPTNSGDAVTINGIKIELDD
ncbi:polyphenol oxidase, chloroplastic-like [Andrographis paniculata]|uniref:polyphenol oxidase, chloroplastic-like n=1 Tax=Andrographis paniculata TaxID=175694 RepID=UPI0021E986FA|nr:polyphenol oxidase, chloroplastic-like [Andrographis paniculata]